MEFVPDVSKAPRPFANLGTTHPMTHRTRYESYRCEKQAFPTNFQVANV